MAVVLREEKKYLLNTEEALKIEHLMREALISDRHNGPDGYIVRSLYFDTTDDTDFFDKQAGVENRKKLRLRTYDPNGDFALLEIKQKTGDQQLKRSVKLSREDAEDILKGNYDSLLKYQNAFADECYSLMREKCYRPVCVVQYNRTAFMEKENDIRITLDSNIVATESNFNIFDPKLNMNPVMDRFDTVLEVKYNRFLLSYVKDIVSTVEKSQISVSKYVLARQNSMLTQLF